MSGLRHQPLIVGDPIDPHVAAVVGALASVGQSALVVDLERIANEGVVISEREILVRADGRWLSLDEPRSGWLRRLHRADWGVGVTTGSLEALELGTWHSAYTWVLDNANVRWLSTPLSIGRAESKLRQWRAAVRLGLAYPRTLVTTSSEAVESAFAGEVVVKPIGTGQFLRGDRVRTVFAHGMTPNDSRLRHLRSVPFIVQERLLVSRHLRVVTVGSRLWVASLSVEASSPVDWRRVRSNHDSFEEEHEVPLALSRGALLLAHDLGLGYSSQDWVQTLDGELFVLDVNPAGQWLFLPNQVGTAIASAIAESLVNDA